MSKGNRCRVCGDHDCGRFGPNGFLYCRAHVPLRYRPQPACVLCNWRRITRPKRLCGPCSYTPAGRRTAPVQHSCTNRKGARADFNGTPPPAPAATDAAPGSEEKIVVLQARVAAGVQPYHPRDRRIDLS